MINWSVEIYTECRYLRKVREEREKVLRVIIWLRQLFFSICFRLNPTLLCMYDLCNIYNYNCCSTKIFKFVLTIWSLNQNGCCGDKIVYPLSCKFFLQPILCISNMGMGYKKTCKGCSQTQDSRKLVKVVFKHRIQENL